MSEPAPPRDHAIPLNDLAEKIRELERRAAEIGSEELGALQARHSREYEELYDRQEREHAELDATFEPQRLPLRIEQGRLLIEARKLVRSGQWEKWCARNLAKSQSDIRACMALAGAEDPIAAVEVERSKVRERVAKHRKAKSAAAVTEDDVTAEKPITPPQETVHDTPLWAGEPANDAPADEPSPTVFDRAKELGAKWWNTPGLLDARPTTPEEAEIQYNALGWLERDFQEPLMRNIQAQGDKLEEAHTLFPTRKAWKEWIASLKTCPGTTRGVNVALFYSTKARAARAEHKEERITRLRSQFPELAMILERGDKDALELVHAATDIWEDAANNRAPASTDGIEIQTVDSEAAAA